MPIFLDRQQWRLLARSIFFLLFVLAPPLDLFRLDLTLGHFVLFGQEWTLGLDAFRHKEIGAGMASWNLLWRGLLPIVAVVGGVLMLSYYWGRLYCGWLCPHFSVVEMINALMLRARGRPTLWEADPARGLDGAPLVSKPRYWLLVVLVVLGMSLLWAVVLITYLLPPKEIYGNLLHGTLTRNQGVFIGVAFLAFVVEFTLARHLFCRFGCAVGLFQSYAWMTNPKAQVVGFVRHRSASCMVCVSVACEQACPMRLKPRQSKRAIFSCTQCTECISACTQVNPNRPIPLIWARDRKALDKSRGDGVIKGLTKTV